MRASILLLFLVACGGNGAAPAARQATIEFFTAGPAGGTFALPGGIQIELPPGAVTEPTEFRYEELDPATLPALPAPLRATRAFRILGRRSTPVASPQLAAVDEFDEVSLAGNTIVSATLDSVVRSDREDLPIRFLARVEPDSLTPLDMPRIRGGEPDRGIYRIDGVTRSAGDFAIAEGIGTVEFSLLNGTNPGLDFGVRRNDAMVGPVDVVAGDTTATDGATVIDPLEVGKVIGTLSEQNPFLAAFIGLSCGRGNLYSLACRIELESKDFRSIPPVPEKIAVILEGAGSCEPEQSADDRDGSWIIPLLVSLVEAGSLVPPGWFDTPLGQHLIHAYASGFTLASVFDLTQAVAKFDFGGLTGNEYGVVVLGDPSENRTLAQLSQPSVQTVIVYGAGGGFVRKFTPGQGFAPLTISLGAQFTHGSAMNNDPLSGIGVITNNISNNIRLVSGYASGALPAGVPGQVSPRGFPAGAGKIFCTFMRSTARTLVVTQGSPGAVWIVKDLTFPVVTKLADTENDPRRIRVCGDIVVISNFGSNSLSIYRWNQDDTFTFIKHEPVCNGPVGFDLKKLDDGRVAIVSTGFFDHKYAITVVDPDLLTVKSGPCTPLISGCEDPGHAIWVPDEDEHRIVASCNGTGNLASMAVTIPE